MHQISPQITTLRHVSNIPFPRKNLLRISSEIFLFCWSYVIFVSVHCTAIINVFREFFWKRPKNGTFCHVQSYMGPLKLSCIIQQQIMAVSVRPDHFIILPLKPLVQTSRSFKQYLDYFCFKIGGCTFLPPFLPIQDLS